MLGLVVAITGTLGGLMISRSSSQREVRWGFFFGGVMVGVLLVGVLAAIFK